MKSCRTWRRCRCVLAASKIWTGSPTLQTSSASLRPTTGEVSASVTRFFDFWNSFATNFLTKVAQIFNDLLAILKTITLWLKHLFNYFLSNGSEIWATFSSIWSHWFQHIILTFNFVKGSITFQLTSCLTGLDSTKQRSRIQIKSSGGQPSYSGPYEESECSLL